VAGVAHDLYRIPPVIEGWVYGYVSMDTIRWMGQPEGYNELYLDAGTTSDIEIRALAEKAADRIEGEGLPVYQKTLLIRIHPMGFIIETMLIPVSSLVHVPERLARGQRYLGSDAQQENRSAS
jgi:hypothetical protein